MSDKKTRREAGFLWRGFYPGVGVYFVACDYEGEGKAGRDGHFL
jgi:hypothetical protein